MATVAFFVFAIMAVAAAWGVVTSKNIVHSALFLALSLTGIAVLYILLNADFLAAVQLLIYTGAVAIMIVFAVMLTLRGEVNDSSPENRSWAWGALGSMLVFVMMILVILTNSVWRIIPDAWTSAGSALDLAWLLMQQYIIPFEAVAILLTVALIGAIVLAKGVKESK